MRINTNISAINTQRNLSSVQGSLAKSVERLSSGLRINRAGDDAAGLTISEKLRGQVKGLNQAVRNAQDGISMIQTAEGGLNESHTILQRMRELAVQASNDTLTDEDRGAISSELSSLNSEINRISSDTQFNTKALLDGTMTKNAHSVDLGNSTVQDGTVLSASANAMVTKVDVSGVTAATAQTFTFSVSNNTVTLDDGNGTTQTLTVADMDDPGNTPTAQTLDFDDLGIKITINGSDAASTGNNIADDLNGLAITTAAGADNSASFQVGANAGQNVSVSIASSNTAQIGDATANGAGGTATNLNQAVGNFANGTHTTAEAQDLIKSLDAAIKDISENRSNLGAVQNRLEHSIENLATSSENLSASESRIRDADMAAEMVGFTRSNILQQAGTSILSQANQLPQGILSLLR